MCLSRIHWPVTTIVGASIHNDEACGYSYTWPGVRMREQTISPEASWRK